MLKALASAWPESRKPLPPRPSRLDPFKPAIDEILRADLDYNSIIGPCTNLQTFHLANALGADGTPRMVPREEEAKFRG